MAEDYKVGADRNLPIDTRDSWDEARARAGVFEWAGWPDNPDPAKARRAFLCYDAAAPSLKGSYSLPFAEYDGRLEANAVGLRAAASRLPQKRGLSSAVRKAARAVLDSYFARLNKGKQRDGEAEEDAFRLPYATLEVRAAGADLLELAKKQAPDPDLFERYPPLMARALISNAQRDAYYTRMMPSTLRNYAADAEAGVTVLDSHNAGSQQTILGRSLTGKFYDGRGGGGQRVESDFYIVTGDGGPGDRARMLIGTGTVRDVSVGFYRTEETRVVCSFCGKDMLGGFARFFGGEDVCTHYPGQKVLPLDESGKPKKGATPVTVEGHIELARLAEFSPVYDGATPGAGIIGVKARMLADAGLLRPDEAELLEAQYRINLPAIGRAYALGGVDLDDDDPEEGEERDMDERLTELLKRARASFALGDDAADGDVLARLIESHDTLAAEVKRLTPIADEVESLRAEASDGRAYRAKLVEDVLAEGVRAFADFDPKDEEGELKDLSIRSLEKRLARYGEIAARSGQFPAGRGSSDLAHDPPNGKPVDRPVSIAAYRV